MELIDDNPILRMIPEQLKNLTPEMKAQLKELFVGTHFDCPECGGDCIPYNTEKGVCFQCKHVAELHYLPFTKVMGRKKIDEIYLDMTEVID